MPILLIDSKQQEMEEMDPPDYEPYDYEDVEELENGQDDQNDYQGMNLVLKSATILRGQIENWLYGNGTLCNLTI